MLLNLLDRWLEVRDFSLPLPKIKPPALQLTWWAEGLHCMKEVIMSGVTGTAGIPSCALQVPHAPVLQHPHCDGTTLTIMAARCFRYITHLRIESFVLVPPLVLRSTEIFLPTVFSWKIYREQPSIARMQEHGNGLSICHQSSATHSSSKHLKIFLGWYFYWIEQLRALRMTRCG